MERIMIPNEDFKDRVKKLQASMKRDGVELFMAYGNEAEPQYEDTYLTTGRHLKQQVYLLRKKASRSS